MLAWQLRPRCSEVGNPPRTTEPRPVAGCWRAPGWSTPPPLPAARAALQPRGYPGLHQPCAVPPWYRGWSCRVAGGGSLPWPALGAAGAAGAAGRGPGLPGLGLGGGAQRKGRGGAGRSGCGRSSGRGRLAEQATLRPSGPLPLPRRPHPDARVGAPHRAPSPLAPTTGGPQARHAASSGGGVPRRSLQPPARQLVKVDDGEQGRRGVTPGSGVGAAGAA